MLYIKYHIFIIHHFYGTRDVNSLLVRGVRRMMLWHGSRLLVWTTDHIDSVWCAMCFSFSFDFWLSSLEELMSAKFFSSIFYIFWIFRSLRLNFIYFFCLFVCSMIIIIIISSQMIRWERCSRTAAAANAFTVHDYAAAGDHFVYDYENRFKLNLHSRRFHSVSFFLTNFRKRRLRRQWVITTETMRIQSNRNI